MGLGIKILQRKRIDLLGNIISQLIRDIDGNIDVQVIDQIVDQRRHGIDEQDHLHQRSDPVKIDAARALILGNNALGNTCCDITDQFRTVNAHYGRNDHQDQRSNDPGVVWPDIAGQLF